MPSKVLALIFLGLIFPSLADAQQFDPTEPEYLWPTNASSYLSSTFGETRSAHFHSALDIKTWGQEGYDIYATRNGVVERIVIGPDGYGKAVYLRHDDNSYSVYAHLQQFSDPIREITDKMRMEDYSFELDAWIRYMDIEVDQGDLIGFTGSTGIGPPHLHFELRTPSNEPFNPLKTNLGIQDTIPPTFKALSVEPLSIESRITGKNQLYVHDLASSTNTTDTLQVNGPIGLGVNVFDRANDVTNSYAVYKLEMLVNGNQYFHSRMDQFSFLNSHQMFIDRVYPLLESTGEGFQRLYLKKENTLPFYSNLINDGKLNLPEGNHNVTITATDFNGNKRTKKLVLKSNPTQSQEPFTENDYSDSDISNWKFNNWEWFSNWINIPIEQFSDLTITPLSNTQSPFLFKNKDQIQINLKTSGAYLFNSKRGSHFTTRKITKEGPTYITSTNDQSLLRIPEDTFYEDQQVGFYVQPFEKDSIRFEVLPTSAPVKKDFRLFAALDSIQQQLPGLSLYQYDSRKDTLSYIESTGKGDFISAEIEKTGPYYLLADTTAPDIGKVELEQWENGQWIIFIEAKDNRSGIDHTTAKGIVNGERGIIEFAPEDNQIIYYHPNFVPSTENILELEIEDNMGNKTTDTLKFFRSET